MKKILAILVILVFCGFSMALPDYPKIDENKSLNEIKYFIDKTIRSNSSYYIQTARISQKRPNEYIKETELFIKNYTSCKNDKDCIIDTYNDYMDDWTHFQLEKEAKQQYTIDIFGYKVAKAIYETFPFLY